MSLVVCRFFACVCLAKIDAKTVGNCKDEIQNVGKFVGDMLGVRSRVYFQSGGTANSFEQLTYLLTEQQALLQRSFLIESTLPLCSCDVLLQADQ